MLPPRCIICSGRAAAAATPLAAAAFLSLCGRIAHEERLHRSK